MTVICIIGTGYVGLTTGVCLAEIGYDVVCLDIDEGKIEKLKSGVPTIYEHRLEELLHSNLKSGRLKFISSYEEIPEEVNIFYLCLPTPQSDDGSAELSYLESAAESLSSVVKQGDIVITKSTVPVGTTRKVGEIISQARMVSNPEFLREGVAINDWFNPSRIILGSDTDEAAQEIADLYTQLNAPIVKTTIETSEMIKYASNTFLAVKLSYVNTIAELCEKLGADVGEVTHAMGLDSRIGDKFLNPGPGWGGSCFPKDLRALTKTLSDNGGDTGLLEAAWKSNEHQFDRIANRIIEENPKIVAVLGLAFKAETDDVRSSPAMEIIHRITDAGIEVAAYDPMVKHPVGAYRMTDSPYHAAQNADMVVILTESAEYTSIDWSEMAKEMEGHLVIDCRRIISPDDIGGYLELKTLGENF